MTPENTRLSTALEPTPWRICLIGPWSQRRRIKARADRLRAMGYAITSRWHDRLGKTNMPELPHESLRRIADANYDAIDAAQIVVAQVQRPGLRYKQGAHNGEIGYAHCRKRHVDRELRIILVGSESALHHYASETDAVFGRWQDVEQDLLLLTQPGPQERAA